MRPDQVLIDMKKQKEYFIGIDSDGCAFDSMEIKHKECFCPNTINYWDLQPISKYAREAAEFVNLYSKFRGINRFPALIKVIDLLSKREECIKRGYKSPNIDELRNWVDTETKLGNPALIERVKNNSTPLMEKALKWSQAVNETVTEIVRNVPPFPFVRESLEKMAIDCDIVCVSATPNEALEREWEEHDIAKYTRVIAGQEIGNKKESLITCAKKGYDSDKMLMIGDAPGDLNAARAANCLFYPINPGDEEQSWKVFLEKAYGKFINGTYKGEYENSLIEKFDSYLPNTPPWEK